MKKLTLFWIILISVLISSCGKYDMARRDFFALDTFCSVKVDQRHGAALEKIEEYVLAFDDNMSRYKEGSLISQLNRERTVRSGELARILGFIEENRIRTRGFFDPVMGNIIDIWDFSGGGHLPERKEIQHALKVKKDTSLNIEEGGLVSLSGRGDMDLGGIMKGVILDGVVDICKKNGVREAVINLGGDVALYAEKNKTWNVGVQDPGGNGLWTWIRCTGTEIYAVTSGDYERYFERDGVRYHHILDPFTGYPSAGVRSVTVLADTGMKADLLSTAWFAMGESMKIVSPDKDTSVLALFADGTAMFKNLERKQDEEGGVFYSVTR